MEVFEPNIKFLDHPKLLISLHGDQQEIEAVHDYWNPSRFYNHIVAIPLASEVAFTDGHTWSDVTSGVTELKSHYDQLITKYNMNKIDITLCSFSGGTSVALEAVLNKDIEVTNLIFVAPPLPNLEDLKEKLSILKECNISVYILCGDKDTRFLPVAKKFASYLKDLDVHYKLNIARDTKHEYPTDFDSVLLDMKKFLNFNL